jgi:hypothetical protein
VRSSLFVQIWVPVGTMCAGLGIPYLWSGWADLNRRPHGPKPCALTRLRHTPLNLAYSKLAEWVKQRGLDGTL